MKIQELSTLHFQLRLPIFLKSEVDHGTSTTSLVVMILWLHLPCSRSQRWFSPCSSSITNSRTAASRNKGYPGHSLGLLTIIRIVETGKTR